MQKSILVIFQKSSRSGNVKTRLAREVGEKKAREIYEFLCQYTHLCAKEVSCPKVIYFDQVPDVDQHNHPDFFSIQTQVAGDLGQRMRQAFQELFLQGYERIVLIGTDCLQLSSKELKQAFEVLDVYDVVLGPATDGGYYLVGMQTFVPELFESIDWSTSRVMEQSKERLRQTGHSHFSLKTLSDIDFKADWERDKHLIGLN